MCIDLDNFMRSCLSLCPQKQIALPTNTTKSQASEKKSVNYNLNFTKKGKTFKIEFLQCIN